MAQFGIYIHWPFCESKCPYCDFNSHVRASINQKDWTNAYIKSLYYWGKLVPNSKIHSIFFGGGIVLLLVTQIVLEVDPWFSPQNLIPLGGMIFASSMNGVSLAAERLIAETNRGLNFENAKGIALRASLIPIINSLFAVGLVSFPGMMTGQILSGVAPHIAVRYQILVMLMLFSAVGFTSVFFLRFMKKVSNI